MKHFNRSTMFVRSTMFALAIVGLSALSPARQEMKRITVQGDAFMIPEAGALVTEEGGMLKVLDVMPANMRPKGYEDIDIHVGDEIRMINGAHVKSVKELREAHERMAVGGELKIGINRGGEKHLVAFKKADPKDLPKRKMMTVDGNPADGELVPALALVAMKNGTLTVTTPLPEAEGKLMEHDILVSLNGKKSTSVKEFIDAYMKIPVGSEMTLAVKRAGAEKTVKMKKTEPQGQVIIKK